MAFRVRCSVQLQDRKMHIEAFANSADEKPTDFNGQPLSEGSTCVETDTGEVFLFSEEANTWNKIGGEE